MSVNFLIADSIAAMNVAARSHLVSVLVRKSTFMLEFLHLLYVNGVIRSFSVSGDSISVHLKYYRGISVFSNIKVISRPVKGFFDI